VYQGIWNIILPASATARSHTTIRVTKLLLIGEGSLCCCEKHMLLFFLTYCTRCWIASFPGHTRTCYSGFNLFSLGLTEIVCRFTLYTVKKGSWILRYVFCFLSSMRDSPVFYFLLHWFSWSKNNYSSSISDTRSALFLPYYAPSDITWGHSLYRKLGWDAWKT